MPLISITEISIWLVIRNWDASKLPGDRPEIGLFQSTRHTLGTNTFLAQKNIWEDWTFESVKELELTTFQVQSVRHPMSGRPKRRESHIGDLRGISED